MSPASLAAELAALDAHGLRRRRRVLETPQRAHVEVDGCEYIAFCSNDYLGLAAHPQLVEAAREGAALHGVGAGASHLILGHMRAHHDLELALSAFVRTPAALFLSSGYMANIGLITALVGRGDAIFADKLNHASLNDAVLLSRAEHRRYAHLDLTSLERLLRGSSAKTKVIVSDAVFSMDGDIAPARELLTLAERYDAWLVLDDAHGFGVLGASGRGILEHAGIQSPRIAYMATLGKAAGVYGAFVAGGSELIETLVQRARTYIYTTATPPLLAHTISRSLEIMASDPARRAHLFDLIAALKRGLRDSGWRLMPSDTAIQPLVVGGAIDALALSERLAERGLLVPAIRPPTVPRGTARLRISLSADHQHADVQQLVTALGSMCLAA
ncbi:MAG: 8-amino-7-oxononanoate synthase [Burkholderiales bacterium]